MKSLFPADTYIVVNKSIINDNDKKILTMLYQPIIGSIPTSLYLSLLSDLDKLEIMSNELTHQHLMFIMKLKLEDIKEARETLEAIGLLKTYYKEDNITNYVYELYSPLEPNEVFNHPILNIVLYNNLGKKEYNKIVEYFKLPKTNMNGYTDITRKFSDVFESVSKSGFDILNDTVRGTSKLKLDIDNNLDFDFLIAAFPKKMVNEKIWNNETKNLINSLSFIYNIDVNKMQDIIRISLNEKGMIDKQLFRKTCRNYYQFEEGGKLPSIIYKNQPEYLRNPIGDTSKRAKMIFTFETVSPYEFLKHKNNNTDPTLRELRILENLLVDLELKPGVVNVLLDYVLKTNDNKLNKNYVETIASQWKRNNIETVEEAMSICEKQHKKYKKIPNKKQEKVPTWFDQEIKNEQATEEEKNNMEELLKGYR